MYRFYKSSSSKALPYKLCISSVLITFLLLVSAINGKAQCMLDCVDTVYYSLDFPCTSVIDENDLMTTTTGCTGPFTIEITDAQNNSYGNVVTMDMIGLEFIYSVTSSDPESCTGILVVQDTEEPIFNCPGDVTLDCTVPIDSVPLLEMADVSDCSTFTIDFLDTEDSNFNCQDMFTLQVSRNYMVDDFYSNINTSCTQTISFVRPSLSTVQFPPDILEPNGLLCPNPDTSITNTGRPTINDIPLENSVSCDVVTSYINTIIPSCDGAYLLRRTWTVTNICTNETVSEPQDIFIIDTVGPVVIPPADFTVDADEVGCVTDVTIPPAMITDECSSIASVTTQGSFGVINGNGGIVNNQGLGDYLVTYTATDDCGNTSTGQMTFTVADLSPPEVLCDLHRIVAVNNLGYGEIDASSFDAGSFDLCGSLYYKAKRMFIPAEDCTTEDNPAYQFDDDLRLCCSDIENNNIMVRVRIYDQDPGPGPVSDDALPGRFTECMVEVEVQDQLAPNITCPANVIIDCHDDYSDLSLFGEPEYGDNCEIAVFTEDVDEDINECGTGSILRTFTVIDGTGFIRQCDQTITIENQNPFDGENPDLLAWPDDVTIEGCDPNANTDPEETGFPIILDDACALIGTSVSDEIFITVPDACYKILRKWKVIDWCQYDSGADDPYTAENGYWEHTQAIKIIDTEDPVITGHTDTIVANFTGDCSDIFITLNDILTDDCTPQSEMGISYTVDLFSDGDVDRELEGSNASGIYPNGSHLIRFKAEDHCNNEGYYEFTLHVEDAKSPIAVVLNGLAIDLMNIGNGQGMLEIEASSFDGGSYDNCTPSSELIFSFSNDPGTSSIMFDCDDVGIQDVIIFVTDQNGNQSQASTYVIIQDNEEFCEEQNTTVVQISGLIMDADDNIVTNTMIETANESMSEEVEVGEDGLYVFEGIETGYPYDITPYNNLNPLEGVSSLDLLLIQKHILSIETLDSPYNIIAADINNNESVSASDLVELQRLLLHLDEGFSNNTSWRFLYSNFEFSDPTNPFTDELHENYDINYLVEDMDVDFTGIKIGDVNNSALVNLESNVIVRDEPLAVSTKDIQLNYGQEYTIDLVVENRKEINGIQLELLFDNEAIELRNIYAPGLNSFGNSNYNIDNNSSLALVSWIDAVNTSNLMFKIDMKVKESVNLSDVLSFSRKYLKPEAYDKFNEVYELKLRFDNPEPEPDFILGQNLPNPSTGNTIIPVLINKESKYTLEVLNVTGKNVYKKTMDLPRGNHQIEVNIPELETGVYIYKLSSNSNFRTKRMIIAR